MAKLIARDQQCYALKIKIFPHFVSNEEIGRNTKQKKNAKQITIIHNFEKF